MSQKDGTTVVLAGELLTTGRAFSSDTFNGVFETDLAENMPAVGGYQLLALGLYLRQCVQTDWTGDPVLP